LSKLLRAKEQSYPWKFPGISYLRQSRCARKIPKPVLETTLIIKETTYTLDFMKYFVVYFGAFSVFLEDSLNIFSETLRAVKKLSTES
jgi:hypothetical protein